jgi:5-methylcytosine-specific restriction endonuclease McrA
MAWVWLDDEMPECLAIMTAAGSVGDSALTAFVSAIAYSNRTGSDGFIPGAALGRLTLHRSPAKVARALADADLWREVEGGYLIPDFARFRRVSRADREADAAGFATPRQIADRVAFYGGLCWICRAAPADTIDHVKPLAAGGSPWPANLRPACRPCNSSKGARWPFAVRRPS